MSQSIIRRRPVAPVEERAPVHFFSIEIVTPAETFWQSLARLLFTLGAAARRKGEARR